MVTVNFSVFFLLFFSPNLLGVEKNKLVLKNEFAESFLIKLVNVESTTDFWQKKKTFTKEKNVDITRKHLG